MTIHQAKGLEFEHVFIVGLEEGFYPSNMSLGSKEEIEEERRILYVAITRAKTNCYISFANKRIMGHELRKRAISRFVEEINNSELIQIYNPPKYEEYRQEKIKLDSIEKIINNKKKFNS